MLPNSSLPRMLLKVRIITGPLLCAYFLARDSAKCLYIGVGFFLVPHEFANSSLDWLLCVTQSCLTSLAVVCLF